MLTEKNQTQEQPAPERIPLLHMAITPDGIRIESNLTTDEMLMALSNFIAGFPPQFVGVLLQNVGQIQAQRTKEAKAQQAKKSIIVP